MQVESDAQGRVPGHFSLRATVLGLAAAALLMAGCSERNMLIQSKSEVALAQAGVKTIWTSPTGDTSQQNYDAAVAKCKEEIKAATTDAIQMIPPSEVDRCLIGKGWSRSASK